MLTQTERSEFHSPGYLRLRGAVSEGDVELFRARVWEDLKQRCRALRSDPATWPALNPKGINKLARSEGILQRFNAPKEIIQRVSVRRNVTLPVHHPLAYDRELADYVYELNRADFEQYGFEKNSWLYDSDAPHTTSYLSGVIEELSEYPVE